MTELINESTFWILFRLLLAYISVDLLFQLGFWGALYKKQKWYFRESFIQGLLGGIIVYIFISSWTSVWLPISVFFVKLILGEIRGKKKESVLVFFLTLAGHLISIFFFWIILVSSSVREFTDKINFVISNEKLLVLTLAYIIIIWPTGTFIGRITEPWRQELSETLFQGLEKAGLWIGRLERILILTFVLLNRYEAIGFLIAAKSIFRFGEINTSKNRKEAEYILFGTMLSFVIAILIGILTTNILKNIIA
jgi:hypothetical protein